MTTSHKQDSDFKNAMIPDSFLEEVVDWIKANMEPEDVFNKSDLMDWAKENDYVQEV